MNQFVLTAGILVITATPAFAVSRAVKQACRDDYFSLCSQYEVGSDGLRACMRSNKKKLSKHCAATLAKSGEATQSDIEDYRRAR